MTDTPTPNAGAAASPPDASAPANRRAGNTNRSGGRNYNRSNNNNWNRGTKFAGTVESIETLSTKTERKGKENFASKAYTNT